ncbi:hypothetical protein [Methanolobus vulcani]|uniref:Uncharacterized protein n=1 Tax=Methanolobus vulcani TaxID=38026 RepID=A0A7Z8P218_9EURY|nr:hypothetical protein [Methanolobus vulcani]TQD25110.1 hypothetical protein FKV42_08645 [Methanolobus vulcani]
MSSDIMKDFDTIAPVKRVARIGGEEVDVSVFSTRATLKLIDMTDSPEKIQNLENGKNIESFVEVVATACQRSNPKITADWLMDNVDMFTLVEFSKFVLEPIIQKLEEIKPAEDTEKNCQ